MVSGGQLQSPTTPSTVHGDTGWAVNENATWSHRPALIMTVVAIVLFPVLFVIGYFPHTNDAKVVYPALREQMIGPTGATLGQPPTPHAGQ